MAAATSTSPTRLLPPSRPSITSPEGPTNRRISGGILLNGPASPTTSPHVSPSAPSRRERAVSTASSTGTSSDGQHTNVTSPTTSDATTEATGSPCGSPKLKFAPLPSSGRKQRANSISVGVAARAQMLAGSGLQRTTSAPQDNVRRWQPGPPPPDVVYTVKDVSLAVKKGWSKIRRRSSVASNDPPLSPTLSHVPEGSAIADEDDGDTTPRRAPSPDRHPNAGGGPALSRWASAPSDASTSPTGSPQVTDDHHSKPPTEVLGFDATFTGDGRRRSSASADDEDLPPNHPEHQKGYKTEVWKWHEQAPDEIDEEEDEAEVTDAAAQEVDDDDNEDDGQDAKAGDKCIRAAGIELVDRSHRRSPRP